MPQHSRSLVKWIAMTGLLAGLLDIIAAIVRFKIKSPDKDPVVVFKYIASAVFGKEAYTGGDIMIAWGVFFHFLIAMLFTIFFFLIYPKIKLLSKNAIITGLVYGIFVWLMMNRVVLPLSKLKTGPFKFTSETAIQMGILMLFIGLPISLMAKKYYLYRK